MLPFDYNATLIGYVHEGTPAFLAIPGATPENYYELFEYGKRQFDEGDCSKFVIALVADAEDGRRMVGHVRPDQSNFQDAEGYAWVVTSWADETCIPLYERNFGGLEWNATYERIFENSYGFPIAGA